MAKKVTLTTQRQGQARAVWDSIELNLTKEQIAVDRRVRERSGGVAAPS